MVASTCARMVLFLPQTSFIQSAKAVRSVAVTSMIAGVDGVAMLAHQGGWDEVLMIGAPVLLIAGLLMLAKRRVDAAARAHRANPHPQDD